MKWLKTLILFDKGDVMSSDDWSQLHESYKRAIESIKNPPESDLFTLRERIPIPRKGKEAQKFDRNGVTYIKNAFYDNLTTVQGWKEEEKLDFGDALKSVKVDVTHYPSGIVEEEPLATGFGDFDFATVGPNGIKAVIEWETGNISSSHRSVNKLCICLNAGIIQAGVVIVPSRDLYKHLTDRIGNIDELSGYLSLWQSTQHRVQKGLLAITVVEHDHLTTDVGFPLLKRGNDGRAKEGARNLGRLK